MKTKFTPNFSLLCVVLAIFTLSCALKNNNSNITCLNFKSDFELIDKKADTLGNYESNNLVYFIGNDVIYRKEGIYFDSTSKMNAVFDYFIFTKKNQKGFIYEWENSFSKPILFDVDSFKQFDLFGNLTFEKLINPKYDFLIEEVKNENNKTLLMKYANSQKKDDSFPDSTYLYFDDRLSEIPFALSPELDSLADSKLYKIKFIFGVDEKVKSNTGRVSRSFVIELKKVEKFNPDTVKMIYSRYLKDEALLTRN